MADTQLGRIAIMKQTEIEIDDLPSSAANETSQWCSYRLGPRGQPFCFVFGPGPVDDYNGAVLTDCGHRHQSERSSNYLKASVEKGEWITMQSVPMHYLPSLHGELHAGRTEVPSLIAPHAIYTHTSGQPQCGLAPTNTDGLQKWQSIHHASLDF